MQIVEDDKNVTMKYIMCDNVQIVTRVINHNY